MGIIFTIEIWALTEKIRPNYFGPPGFPLNLKEISSELGCNKYFSTRTKTLNFLKKQIKKLEKENIVYYTLTSLEIDSNKILNYELLNKNFKTLINGADQNKPFYGTKKINKYQVGDWVVFFEGEQVLCGIIGSSAYTQYEVKKENIKNLTQDDNCYYILWDNFRNLQDNFAHSHIHENLILEKIPSDDDILRTYLTSPSIYKLENRFKEYLNCQSKRKAKD